MNIHNRTTGITLRRGTDNSDARRLIATGHVQGKIALLGERFDANKGRPMREWLSLDPDSGADWISLAGEALRFAGGVGLEPGG
jgi:hypothetical protein